VGAVTEIRSDAIAYCEAMAHWWIYKGQHPQLTPRFNPDNENKKLALELANKALLRAQMVNRSHIKTQNELGYAYCMDARNILRTGWSP
jgi:hypothetical protein